MAGRQAMRAGEMQAKDARKKATEDQKQMDAELEEFKRKKQEEDLVKMRSEIATANAKKDEEDRIAEVKEDARKLERAKDVFERLLAKAKAGAQLVSLVNWKQKVKHQKVYLAVQKEQEQRNKEHQLILDLEAELKAEFDKGRREEQERAEAAATARGQPLTMESAEDIENQRPPDERDGGNRLWAVDNLLIPDVRAGIRNMHIEKVGKLVIGMREKQYRNDQINSIVKALYLTQTEEDMRPAFRIFDQSGRGEVVATDFQEALKVIGEDVPGDKIDKLFEEVDADGSGTIDFEEFCVMMRKFNPMPQSITKKQYSSAGGTVAAVLDDDVQKALHPLQKKKAGKICQNMLKSKYNEYQVNCVVRALFCGRASSDPVWQKAWEVFDYDGGGSLDAKEFRRALKLLGEKFSEENFDDMFMEADEDGSGEIEFDEFVMLMRKMNPRPTLGELVKGGGRKSAKQEVGEEPSVDVDKGLMEYLEIVDCTDYAEEFQNAGLTVRPFIETETLVSLGDKLKVSNAERNRIFNKIQLYKSRREIRVKLDQLSMKTTKARRAACGEADKSKVADKKSTANLYLNYLARQGDAMLRISPSYEYKELVYRPGQGIAKEMAILRGQTEYIPPVSASDAKFPDAIRSPLKDEEWNKLTSPPRSPEARTPGYELGRGLALVHRHKVKMPGQPRVPYPKRSPSKLDPVDDKPPMWYTTQKDWHQNLTRAGHGPLIGPRLSRGQVGQYEPPPNDRLLFSRSLSRTSPLPSIAAGYESSPDLAPTPMASPGSDMAIPPSSAGYRSPALDFARKIW